MDKELNIIQASNMPEGTEFKVKFPSGRFEEDNIKLCGELFEWCDGSGTTMYKDLINSTFIPIQQPVNFMEVISNDNDNSFCRVEHQIIDKLRKKENIKSNFETDFKDGGYIPFNSLMHILCFYLTSEELKDVLKEGKWYLEE